MKFKSIWVLGMLVAPSLIRADYDGATITLRLIDPDSITVEVKADHDDLFNTVTTFPYFDNKKSSIRLYERRIEAYLQNRLPVQVDGKKLPLRVIQWKPGGKGREDDFDSASLVDPNHYITLGGVLPKQRKKLKIRVDFWAEKPGVGRDANFDVRLVWDDTLLGGNTIKAEQDLIIPISRDSLSAALRRAEGLP